MTFQFQLIIFFFFLNLPKCAIDHSHSDIYNIPSPNVAIHESVDMNAPPTYYSYDQNILNDYHTIRGQNFSLALFKMNYDYFKI